MNWNTHSNLEGTHAFLGASQYHWINYNPEKLAERYKNHLAALRGTETHEFAALCIKRGQKLPKSSQTLNLYVNDAIGYRMTPEVLLYYSTNCYGTADAIAFRNGLLRIHDLKTGSVAAHMEQLKIYAALFCLEYHLKPDTFETELRIYQNDDREIYRPHSGEITPIINQIIEFDKIIDQIKEQEGMLWTA